MFIHSCNLTTERRVAGVFGVCLMRRTPSQWMWYFHKLHHIGEKNPASVKWGKWNVTRVWGSRYLISINRLIIQHWEQKRPFVNDTMRRAREGFYAGWRKLRVNLQGCEVDECAMAAGGNEAAGVKGRRSRGRKIAESWWRRRRWRHNGRDGSTDGN